MALRDCARLICLLLLTLLLSLSGYGQLSAVGTVIIKPSSPNGWAFILETGTTGAGSFIAGPATPPLGSGSVRFTTGAAADGMLIGAPLYLGARLDEITVLQYSTFVANSSTSVAQVVALQLNIDDDITDADIGWKGRLVFEPYYSETVVKGNWQTWDTRTQGRWWGTHAAINGTCSIGSPCTWAQVLANFPNIGIHATLGAVNFKAGSSWPAGFDGN